ncbi:hypothetical protein ABK040_004293 [Willaertia magna]
MITHFFVLSNRGDKIISRNYRYDIFDGVEDLFFHHIRNENGPHYQKPVFNQQGINFFHVRKAGLYVVCTSRDNPSPVTIFEILERACVLIRDFTGQLSEDSIRKNFVLVYELLDELFDFGHVQTTQTNILTYCVQNEPVETVDVPTTSGLFNLNIPLVDPKTVKSTATCLPITKKNDQIFVDVLERINCEFSNKGEIIRSEIIGQLIVKSYLLGNPLIRIALNNDLQIGSEQNASYALSRVDCMNFNEILNLEEFEYGRQLSFYPQDGEINLLNYRVTNNLNILMPFRIFPEINQVSNFKVEAYFKIRADFQNTTSATNVLVKIPVPKNSIGVNVNISSGSNEKDTSSQHSYEYKQNEQVVIWGIKKFQGQTEQIIKLRVTLSASGENSTSGNNENNLSLVKRQFGPLSMRFEIPMHNMSGLQLRYLKIGTEGGLDDSKNKTKQKRWVRYVTQAGSYCGRVY